MGISISIISLPSTLCNLDNNIITVPNVSENMNFDCRNAKEIYYPSPYDCQSYYQCLDPNGPPTKLTCSNDLQFNPIIQKCDDPNSVANVKPECFKKGSMVSLNTSYLPPVLTQGTINAINEKVNKFPKS